MESEYRKGYVYIQNNFAGIIAETEEKANLSYCGALLFLFIPEKTFFFYTQGDYGLWQCSKP